MVHRIVLTGGPSSGKTTVLEKIKNIYRAQGIRVFVIDETATYLINNGIKPFGDDAVQLLDFQELVMRMQLAKEEVFDRAIEMLPDIETLVVYDRGTIDNSAYINEKEFQTILARLNNVKSFSELMNKYDLVINLVGSSSFYTTENNAARSENTDEAIRLGEATLNAWTGHPKLKIVLPYPTMDGKINEVLNIINEEIKKTPVKRQEKYLVDLGNTDTERIIKHGRITTIEQAYLESDDNIEKRVRKTEINGSVSYSLSVYKIEGNSKIIVSERKISEKEYILLLEFQKKGTSIIRKNRYYFSDMGEYFYLDIFADNQSTGILEINIQNKEQVTIPSYVTVLENVTGKEEYYNHKLAESTAVRKVKKYD